MNQPSINYHIRKRRPVYKILTVLQRLCILVIIAAFVMMWGVCDTYANGGQADTKIMLVSFIAIVISGFSYVALAKIKG